MLAVNPRQQSRRAAGPSEIRIKISIHCRGNKAKNHYEISRLLTERPKSIVVMIFPDSLQLIR